MKWKDDSLEFLETLLQKQDSIFWQFFLTPLNLSTIVKCRKKKIDTQLEGVINQKLYSYK